MSQIISSYKEVEQKPERAKKQKKLVRKSFFSELKTRRVLQVPLSLLSFLLALSSALIFFFAGCAWWGGRFVLMNLLWAKKFIWSLKTKL